MANMSNNRINEMATEDQLRKTKEHIDLIGKELPFLQGLKMEERSSLLGIDVNNKAFVEDAIKAAVSNPHLLPEYIKVKDIQKDLALFNQTDELASLVVQALEKLTDTRLLAGSEAYMSALMLYRLFIAAAEAGLPGADSIVAQLKPRFAAQGNRAPKPGTAE